MLGKDVGGVNGFDQGFGGGDVGVVQGGRDEEDVDVVEVFEVFLQEDRIAGLVDQKTVEGEEVTTVVGVGVAIDGKVGVAVERAFGFYGDALDFEGVEWFGNGDPVCGDADFFCFFGAVGGHDEVTGGCFCQDVRGLVAEVVAVFVGDELDIEHGGEVGGGNGRWLEAVVAVEVEVDGDEFAFGADEPTQVTEPADGDLVVDVEEFFEDGVHLVFLYFLSCIDCVCSHSFEVVISPKRDI